MTGGYEFRIPTLRVPDLANGSHCCQVDNFNDSVY